MNINRSKAYLVFFVLFLVWTVALIVYNYGKQNYGECVAYALLAVFVLFLRALNLILARWKKSSTPVARSCEPKSGENIDDFAKRLVDEAIAEGGLVKGAFNDVELVAVPDTSVESIVEWYWGKKGGDKNHGTFEVQL